MEFHIKEARERAGLSQRELADIIGVAPSTLSGYENGSHDPKSVLLMKIATACNCSVDYLLCYEREPASPAPEIESRYNSLDEFGRKLIDNMLRLNENQWAELKRFIGELSEVVEALEPLPETPEQKAARLERENREQADRIAALEKELTSLEGGSTEAV